MVYSLSTKWNIGRHRYPGELVGELLDMGFDSIELSCEAKREFIDELIKLTAQSAVKVESVHNFCPAPTDRRPDGDAYFLSSTDPASRKEAVGKTLRTLETAAALNAKAVVLHLGRVDCDDSTSWLRKMNNEGTLTDEQRRKAVKEAKARRSQTAKPNLEAVWRSLDELSPVAMSLGLTLGLENRYRYYQIPLAQELQDIFERFEGAPLGYWHDMGHAEFLHRLGYINQDELLKKAGVKMVGIHIHDTEGLSDHQAPGTGSADFSRVMPYLRPETIRVLELEPGVSREDVIKGMGMLSSLNF